MARIPDAAQRASDSGAGSSDAGHGDAGLTRADASKSSPTCKPGTYTGTFSGALYAGPLSIVDLTGLINAELVPDAADNLLTVRDVRVEGSDLTGNTISFTFSGRINCESYALEDGLLTDGTLHIASVNAGIAFAGTAGGRYTADPAGVSGGWEVYADASALLSGGGDFSITLAR